MKIKRIAIPTILLSIVSLSSWATSWKAEHYINDDFDLPYQIYHPTGNEKLPLIIHLHGTGEAGLDNQAQLYSGQNIGPDYFISDKIQSIQKAIIIAPQTPKNIRWASTSIKPYHFATTPSTPSMTAVFKLIDELIEKDKNIDTSRIYMVGLSRGGQGVWNAALQRPNFFAAIVPIAGSSSPEDAKRLIHLPIWAFHGDQDTTTDVTYTREMIDALIRNGGSTNNIRYTEIPNGEHPDSWLSAFKDEQLYLWLLQHKK
ncbi:TPA: prolyl oligopeptidase family serine peptidase [Photobacterium damselae]